MMRLVVSAALVALSSYHSELVQADDTLNSVVTQAFEFAGYQLTALEENTLTNNDKFIDYTDEEGRWSTISSSGKDITKTVWTSGMVVGMYWHLYEATGDNMWKEAAEGIQIGLEGVELLDDNDIGFQVQNSFGLGYRLVGKDSFKDKTLAGAHSLYNLRYQENIPAFWSWEHPKLEPEWEMAVNVDMIMNMEIMLWAAENGGDKKYLEAVEEHADTTWKDLVRDNDYSTFHAADYNKTTGDLVEKGTYQGWQASSTWSRGQAWAVYGFAMVYRYLGEERFLKRSKQLLGYFDENLPDDNVPYADFDASKDDTNPKDSSATAIVASALFELFEQTGEPEYLEKGQEYMSSLLLNDDYFSSTATDGWEALLRRSSKAWNETETGSVTGDYFLLETMVRYKTMAPSILLREEAEFEPTDVNVGSGDGADSGNGYLEKIFNEGELANDIDISELDDDSPVMIWFGVTLDSADFYPDNIIIKGDDGDDGSVTAPVDIPAPTGGWIGGENMVSFSVEAGTFSAIDTVGEIVLVFVVPTEGVNSDVTVDYLIVGHKLKTSRAPASSTADDTESTTGSSESESGSERGSENSASSSSGSGDVCPGSDVPGLLSSDGLACCPHSCKACTYGECTTSSSDGCCVSEIDGESEACDQKELAPCYIVQGETCSNGLSGIETAGVCCPLGCGRCGGNGCSQLSGGKDCCTSGVQEAGIMCSEANEAPCIIGEE